ncbi:hypothetical protein MRB53_024449 [Persea americana]|uniref:Uncharacterized protein n=1 Tax=Persea americana TaxID=3435 RepID=A0ACC2LCH5_PERAE|nr:hypothetical protein MRB53_024449 [Persea americana]
MDILSKLTNWGALLYLSFFHQGQYGCWLWSFICYLYSPKKNFECSMEESQGSRSLVIEHANALESIKH